MNTRVKPAQLVFFIQSNSNSVHWTGKLLWKLYQLCNWFVILRLNGRLEKASFSSFPDINDPLKTVINQSECIGIDIIICYGLWEFYNWFFLIHVDTIVTSRPSINVDMIDRLNRNWFYMFWCCCFSLDCLFLWALLFLWICKPPGSFRVDNHIKLTTIN